MAFSYDLSVDNRSATYPSWPLVFIEMVKNMPAIDPYDELSGSPEVIDLFREESPNFGAHVYIRQITLSPAPTANDPVRVYINFFTREVYVDPDSSHAQAGELLDVLDNSTRWFEILPGIVQTISFRNAPADTSFAYGVRWRKAYSG